MPTFADTLLDARGNPAANVMIEFQALTDAHVVDGDLVGQDSTYIATDALGGFTVDLAPGDYSVRWQIHNRKNQRGITMPVSGGPYDWSQISNSEPVYVPFGAVSPASTASIGGVAVNTNPDDDGLPVVYRTSEVDNLLAAKAAIVDLELETTNRESDVESVRNGGIVNGTLSAQALITTSDADKVKILNLADEVIASLAGGLDPADYLGQITATNQEIETAASSNGKWYSITVSGTLSGTNAPAIAVSNGDRLLSNGTSWGLYTAPPTVLEDESVTGPKIAQRAVNTGHIAEGSIVTDSLSEEVENLLVQTYETNPGEPVAGFATDDGKIALGVDSEGKLAFDGNRYSAEMLGVEWPDANTDFAWGIATPSYPYHKLILGVKQDGTLHGPLGRIGADPLLQISGAGFTPVSASLEFANVEETDDGTAFRFYAKHSSLWLPYRQGKSGNGFRAQYQPADLNHVILYGQSNATRAGNEGGSNNALTTTPSTRHLMFNSYVAGTTTDTGLLAPDNSSDSTTYRAGSITGFRALFEGEAFADDGETMASGCAQTLGTRLGWKFLFSGAAVGGYSITQLTSGEFPYLNLIYQVTQAKAICDAQGISYKVASILFIQGEADQNDTAWHSKLAALVADLDADIKEITEQTEDVIFIIEQMNRPVWSVAEEVDLSIMEAHHSAGGRVYWQSPRYHITMSNHYYPHGKRWRGCHIGETLAKILGDHHEWEGLYLKESSVSGSSLFLRFHVPVAPLVFETSENVASPLTLYGFEATGLTSAEIAADHVVRLTNSGSWSGKTLKYARQAGLASQKGNLGDSDATVAVYNNGSAVPYPLRNWCAAFELSIA